MSTTPIKGLHASIVGSGTILNDGASPNTLTIALTNGNMFEGSADETDIKIDAESKLAIYFIADDASGNVGKNQLKLNWALSSRARIQGAKAHLYLPGDTVDYDQLKDKAGWNLTPGKAPEPVDKDGKIVPNATISSLQGWEIRPNNAYPLKSGESILLVISNIITNPPDGPSMGYMLLHYGGKNVFTTFGPVQRTPNILSGQRVGIGLVNPEFPLSISSKIKPKDDNGDIWSLSKLSIADEDNSPAFGIGLEKIDDNEGYANYLVPKKHGHVFMAGNAGEAGTGLMWIRDPGDVTVARTLGVGGDIIINDNLWIGKTDDSNLTGIVPMQDDDKHLNGLLQIQVRNQQRILISSKTDASSVKITPNLSVEKNLNIGADLTVGANTLVTSNGMVGIGTTNPLFPLSILPGTLGSKISLWDGGDVNNISGFGISNSQLNFIVGNKSTDHVFYAGGNNNNGSELMRIKGTGDVIIPGNLEVTGSVDSIIKIVTMSVCLGGESSNIPDLNKCTTLANGSWQRDVNFGCTFKEKPQVIVALSTWSAYPYGSSGGTSKTGYAFVNMVDGTLTTTNVTLSAYVNEGDGVSSDNFVQVSIIAIGRI